MDETTLEQELAELLNRHSVENESNTPDFILAEYLTDCLDAYSKAVRARTKWFGPSPTTGPNFDPKAVKHLDPKNAMTEERMNELRRDGGPLTQEEMAEGYHFCPEYDFDLVGPDRPEGCTCLICLTDSTKN